MPLDALMSINERRKYLRAMQRRYKLADRSGRKALLDEMEQVTGLHRKRLIRLMNSDLARRPRRQQRGRSYTPEVDDAIRVISESLDYICAERLTPELVPTARRLARHGEMALSPALLEQLGRISVSTVQRILKRVHQDEPRRRRRSPRPVPGPAQSIPPGRIPWNATQPGHCEVDLTHHCGPSSSGEYMHTLQIIDVATGWSERVAVLGRSFLVMRNGFCRIQQRVPFTFLELHPDNGSEFLNWNLVRFWNQTFEGVHLSRSFPWHKNDNRFVEQKNSSLVRAYLGHDRLDSAAQVNAANQLYDKLWLYNNFFQPVMRLQEKVPVASDGRTRVRRRYDTAQTPFDRLCATGAIAPERQEALSQLRDDTNPRQLREEIYDLIEHIFALPNVAPGECDDVALTLFEPSSSAAEVAQS